MSAGGSKFRIGYEFGMLLMLVVSLLSFKQIYDYSRYAQSNNRSEVIRREVQHLELKFRAAEAAQKDYILSGRDSFVKNYNQALADYGASYQRLKALLADSAYRDRSIATLIAATNKKFDSMNSAMRLRAAGQFGEAQKILSEGEGVPLMSTALDEFRTFELSLESATNGKQKDLKKSADVILATICAGTLLALILLILARSQSSKESHNLRNLSRILHAGQEELVRANQKVKISMQAKSDFLANMSHEVRTPLNAITGLSSILTRSGLSAEQKKLVDGIQKSSQSLLDVINPILDYSKIEHEGLTLQLDDAVDLRDLAEQAVEIMRGQAELKKLELRLNVIGAPGFVKTDSVRLKQVFLNLLGNAIKFTARGSVEFRLTAQPEGSSRVGVRFEIIDTGEGIPEEAKQKLFQSFTQSDNSISRRHGGTGLGLSICKAIVEKMEGQIAFVSELGRGTTFYFDLAFPVAAAPAVRPRSVGGGDFVPAPVFRGVRALIVEDNPMNQFVLRHFLGELGATAEIVGSGPEALALLAREKFSLVFLDVQMPGMDGFEATERIRGLPEGKDIFIVATTAHAMTGYREKCLAGGMNEYLPKPISLEALHGLLSLYFTPVAPVEAVTAPPSPPGPTAATSSATPSVNEKRWATLKKDKYLKEMVEIFNTSSPPKNEEIARGLAEKSGELVREAAHFMKSSASAMGFDRLTGYYEELEGLGDVGNDWDRMAGLYRSILAECEDLKPRLAQVA